MDHHAIGIDLGGTYVKYAVVDSQGHIHHEGSTPSDASQSSEAVVNRLVAAVADCKQYAARSGIALCGIGIGTPGIIDESGRIVVGGAENIAGWENVRLADIIESASGLTVSVANDANVMGLGEQKFGAAQGCSDVLFITVGTGIGGAVIIDNRLFGGYRNRGTEFGHTPLIANGEPCACGSVGCLEAYASTTALVRRFVRRCEQSGDTSCANADGRKIVELYHKRHPIAEETMREHWDFLGHGIAGLVNIFSPQKVVVGGGISEAGDFYIAELEKAVRRYSLPECGADTQICAAQLGNHAGAMGAAGLAFLEKNKMTRI